ncbi:MAG: hypothetical protein KDA94_00440 [Acidimicrobiales bacterium]|nr:hypothetical protein [Acidimicrobiales bacterium]
MAAAIEGSLSGWTGETANPLLDRPVKIGRSKGANYDRRIDVVFVCTGNICRSPMAAALLRARLETIAPQVEVGSAGILFDGRRAEPNAVKAMRHLDLDIGDHRAQTVTLDLLEPASLILGMERAQVRFWLGLSEDLFHRSFTLPEFVRSAAVFGPRPEGEPLRSWVERIGATRPRVAYEHDDPLTTVADPMGGSRRRFRECADELAGLIDELVDLAWPHPEPGGDLAAPATTGGIHADRHRR